MRYVARGLLLFSYLVLDLVPAIAQPVDSVIPSSELQRCGDRISSDSLRAHVRFLADDLLEGRGPGSRGDELAQRYIVAKFESLGFQPAAPDGSYVQAVPLIGVQAHPPELLTLRNAEKSLDLRRHDDFVMTSGKPQADVGFEDAEIVFVGYGIVAPEFDWDDFKGVDLTGKVLLIMNNDPSGDPQLFGGPQRLYYGRWDYKYEMAAKRGAAGAIVIHTTPSAGYPYQVVQTSWTGVQFELADKPGPRTEMNGWITEDAARRLTQLSGHDLDRLRAAAESRDFAPVPLGTRMSLHLRCDIRRVTTANVLAQLPGSDPQRQQEAVIFMAHHDHLGMAESRDARGDNIYNGAVDNACGVAALLSIADACAALPEPPRRTILFASVGAEEQGLLGSKYLAANPPRAAGNLAAVVNIDGVNILGPTRDLNVIGLGKSNLDGIVAQLAGWQNRVVVPDQFPDRGYYYRSDQFSLARIGVPGVYLHSGVHVLGKPEGWGKRKLEEWTENQYHQTSDEYRSDWDLRGAVQDVQLLFYTGMAIASQPELPAWNAGDEFEAARKAALQDLGK
jgi:Zn-dependent M28 family amino/carboxypeptidase